ncbi:MAG: hypothetical protein ACFHWZ_06060 [Phycisphaerales bacterium]
MHTTPNRTDLDIQLRAAKAELELVAIRVQAKALKTLEALMDEPEPTGDAKQDAVIARERNRRRMAATQALTHTRPSNASSEPTPRPAPRRRSRPARHRRCHQRRHRRLARQCRASRARATNRAPLRPHRSPNPSTTSRPGATNVSRRWSRRGRS